MNTTTKSLAETLSSIVMVSTPETADEKTLQGAMGIYIADGEWSAHVTIDEAVDMIKNNPHTITVMGHMIQDVASGVWLDAGTYSVVITLD